MRRILSILVVLSVLLLAGCATKTRSDALTTTLKAYGSALRWGDFQSAAQFIDPAVLAAQQPAQKGVRVDSQFVERARHLALQSGDQRLALDQKM